MKTLARRRDTMEILDRLKNVRPDSAGLWGRMSAHQMICHLIDSLRMAMGDKPVSCVNNLARQTIVKWIALYVPLRWPPGIPTRPEIDQELGGTKPVDFAADVAQLEVLLERFTTLDANIDRAVHPIFGRMSKAAWLRWAHLHIDHHLRQFGA
jgi:uncharacterized protein DUF1569